MRFLVLTPYFHPQPGGSQYYIEEQYLAMKKLRPGLEVDIVCYNTNHVASEESYRGLNIYRVSCWEILPGQFALPSPIELLKVFRKLKQKNSKYDLVNAHTRFFDTSWWAPLVARYFNAVSVLTDHCAEKPVHSSVLVNAVTRFVDKYLVPIIASKYDFVTVVSKATQKYLKSLGIKKSVVIYSGVDQSFSQKISKNRQKVRVVFVGRLIRSKGAQLLVDAVLPLLKKFPQLDVTIAGDGPLFEDLKKFEQKGLRLTGRLRRQEVASLLGKSDIFVLPSTHHEGFPISLLEAGAAQCAVITTDQGGTSEIITHLKTGLLIQPNVTELTDAIEQLITNSSLRKKLALQLSTRVKSEFSWKKSAAEFLEAVKK